jgi:hypothetical protein
MTDSHPGRGPFPRDRGRGGRGSGGGGGPRGGGRAGGGPGGDGRGGRPRGPARPDDPAARARALATLHESLDHGNDPEVAARAALAVSDECVEAWLLLADFAIGPAEARGFVRRAVEVATHVLGEAGLREGRGRLGATADGVAYLHALAALARRQVGEDRAAQAIQTLSGLLAMDPADPVQVRGDLLLLLLSEARDEEAEELVAAYPEEASADWMYGRALTKRRRALDDDALARASAALDRAIARFPDAGRALAAAEGETPLGTPPADPVVRGAWDATEGALAWLAERLAAGAPPAGSQAGPRPRTEADREADRRFAAREHVEEALEAAGPRRVELARAALSIWPDCAEAWRAIASASAGTARVEALRKAVAAALRALGRDPAGEASPAGDSEDARSLFAARAAFAEALRGAGDVERAFEQDRRLLAEDPDDTAGAATGAVARLLAAGRDAEAEAALARRAEDAAAGWAWLRVLAAWRAQDRTAAAFALAEAMLTSPMTGSLLCAGDARLPDPEGAAAADARREAERAARAILPAWTATPGAIEWLRGKRPPPAPSRGGPRGRPR